MKCEDCPKPYINAEDCEEVCEEGKIDTLVFLLNKLMYLNSTAAGIVDRCKILAKKESKANGNSKHTE